MKILDLFKKKQPPPRIDTQFGPTTEWARQHAVANMKSDPAIKQRVLNLLIEQMGSAEAGQAEFRRRFPEV